MFNQQSHKPSFPIIKDNKQTTLPKNKIIKSGKESPIPKMSCMYKVSGYHNLDSLPGWPAVLFPSQRYTANATPPPHARAITAARGSQRAT